MKTKSHPTPTDLPRKEPAVPAPLPVPLFDDSVFVLSDTRSINSQSKSWFKQSRGSAGSRGEALGWALEVWGFVSSFLARAEDTLCFIYISLDHGGCTITQTHQGNSPVTGEFPVN